jgi:RNA polymerase sigma-70 factor (ECF subfamily)
VLRTLHDEHARALRRYVAGLIGGDWDRAQDVVQETMLRAWRNQAVLERGGDYAPNWLFGVAKRIVIDQWRASGRRPEVVTDRVPEQVTDDAVQQVADRDLVRRALLTLPAPQRDALFECYYRGAPLAEAAETLGVPIGTVKSRIHYALHAMRQALGSRAI